jgi:hypothetical protein
MFSKKGESKSPDWKQAKGDMKMPRTHPMCAASNKCGLKSGKSGAGGVAQMVQTCLARMRPSVQIPVLQKVGSQTNWVFVSQTTKDFLENPGLLQL